MSSTLPEAWLRGPLAGYAPHLMPAAHALVQAREDIERVTATMPPDELWQRPGGAAAALLEERAVGRARLPATVLGLLFHGAEHTTRHVGQLVTTLKMVRGTISPQ
jgi:hypothetical protein